MDHLRKVLKLLADACALLKAEKSHLCNQEV